jgi:predicted MFS family arabinose efflux permease
MIVCDLARACVMGSVPAAVAFGRLTAAHLFLTGFLGGVFYVFFSAAEHACLPNVVDDEQLTSAVSAQEASQAVTSVVAGPVGGVFLQVARGLPFLADAVSFLASAVCLANVKATFRDAESAEAAPGSLRSEIRIGVVWLWRNSALRMIAIVAAMLQVAISGIALVSIVSAKNNGATTAQIGVLFSALGIGGLVGAAIAPRARARLGLGAMLLSVIWLQALLWVALAFAPNLAAIGVVLAVFAISMPCFGIAVHSYQLEVTPDHLRGRAGTTFHLFLWFATPIGSAVAGLLLANAAPRLVALIFAVWVAALAVVVTTRSGLRKLE